MQACETDLAPSERLFVHVGLNPASSSRESRANLMFDHLSWER
jgi:hypothetical protein